MKHCTTIRTLRNALGLNKKEFAELIDYSLDAVHSWEIERIKVSPKAASKISQSTGVSAYWLLNGKPQNAIQGDRGGRWSLEYFKEIQSEPYKPRSEASKLEELVPSFCNDAIELLGTYAKAIKTDRLPILRYEFSQFRNKMRKAYGHDETAKKAEECLNTPCTDPVSRLHLPIFNERKPASGNPTSCRGEIAV